MITPEQEAELIAYGQQLAAKGAASCRLRGGGRAAVSDSDGGQMVAIEPLPSQQMEDEIIVIPERLASTMRVEQVGMRVYANVPPFHDIVPLLGGESIFAYPRPYFNIEGVDGDWVFVAKRTYTRATVTIPHDPPSTVIEPGFTISAVAVVIEMLAGTTAPANTTPGDPGGDVVEPWPGDYVRYDTLGTLSDGVVTPELIFSPAESIGGSHLINWGSFGDPPPEWTFIEQRAYP